VNRSGKFEGLGGGDRQGALCIGFTLIFMNPEHCYVFTIFKMFFQRYIFLKSFFVFLLIWSYHYEKMK